MKKRFEMAVFEKNQSFSSHLVKFYIILSFWFLSIKETLFYSPKQQAVNKLLCFLMFSFVGFNQEKIPCSLSSTG